MVIDEVQTGNGRTGTLYAYEQYGIVPDVLTTAKGLGGGLPIGACLMFEGVDNILGAGLHGSTIGGNPIACAGAISVIERLDCQLLDQVKEKSAYVFDALKNAEGIRGVSGLGLMIGIETEADCGTVISKCMERGLLPIKAKNKVRLLPPLNIPFELLKKAVEIIKEVAKECVQ